MDDLNREEERDRVAEASRYVVRLADCEERVLTPDVSKGRNAGMRTCLVLTGSAELHQVEEVPADHKPHGVVAGVGDPIAVLDGQIAATPVPSGGGPSGAGPWTRRA